jgi:hypothetical protein
VGVGVEPVVIEDPRLVHSPLGHQEIQVRVEVSPASRIQ